MSTKKKTDKPKTPMEELLGDVLFTNVKGAQIATKTAFAEKDLVALYFSAKWCPPCRAFSPVLKEFYMTCAEKGKLEIVYISSDKGLAEFQEYYGGMPWLSLPEGSGKSVSQIKNDLAKKLQIQGIPTLIVLDVKTGKFVTANARNDVTQAGSSPEKGLETIDAWKAVDPVPIEEADFAQQAGGPTGIMAIIFFFMKNPLYIVGMLYFYKRLMKYLQDSNGDGGAIEADDVPPVQDNSEF